jgi:hypothetical protein
MWGFATGSGEITLGVLHSLANALFGAYSSAFEPLLSIDWTLNQVQVVLWNSPDELIAFSDTVFAQGDVSGANLPANVAACITWPIPQHYKGGHPRSYICGLPVSALGTVTQFDGDFQSALANAAQDFHTAFEAAGPFSGIASVEHGVVSFVAGGAWRAPPVFRRILSGASVDARIDSQRRRLGRDV